jgi:hypothetical protein
MRAVDSYLASNISATTSPFTLAGGNYGIDYIATWSSGSVTLERLAGDGSTYVTVATAFAANGYISVYLPPGTYQLVVDTSTAVYVQIVRIPSE